MAIINSPQNEIKNIIEDFFEYLGLDGRIDTSFSDGVVKIEVQMEEPSYFIGHSGHVLLAAQHLLKAILRRKVEGVKYVDLDINDYKKNKIAYLKEMAREAAEDVVLLKKPKELPPMPAYERRIVHMELTGRTDVTTESIGEGLDRRVVVKIPGHSEPQNI